MADIQRGESIEESTLVAHLQRAQQQSDPDAFDGLYVLFADRVYRYLLARLGDPVLTEEVTSQVFLRLIEKVHMYRIAPNDNVAIFSAWLYRMAYNKMVDILRARRRANLVDLEHAERIAGDGSMDDVHDRLENAEIFSKLQLLNEQQREVLILRFIEELSIAETAQVMQKSEGAIKALQHRALASMRRYLQMQT